MAEIMEGRAADAQIAGLLIGLAMKGERPAEIVGLARTMRAHAVKLSRRFDDVFDTCGTGGDRRARSISRRAVALVVAGGGVRVAKHGNRSVSSLSGSADVFEALGVRVTAPPAVVERCLADAGIGFFFAPTFHPSMRHAGATRGARRPDGVQPARTADESRRRDPPAGRRAAAGVHRAAGAGAAAARIGAGLGRARRRRHRRDLDDRLHEDLRVPRRGRQDVLSASGGRRAAEGAVGGACAADRAAENAGSSAPFSTASAARRATSSC